MATTQPELRGFSSPFEVPVPDGCEGWESMYPYYALFSEERRESEEARGWFRDGMHFPEPMFPFDFVTADSPYMCLGQANTRIFAVPPALGIDHRVLYGWVYMSANAVTDEAEIGRRAQLFGERAGFYFQNWDDQFLNLGYAAYLVFYELCKQSFPDIPDQTIAKMSAGSTSSCSDPTASSAASPGGRWNSASRTRSRPSPRRTRSAPRWRTAPQVRSGWPTGKRSRRRGSTTPTATASTTITARGSTIQGFRWSTSSASKTAGTWGAAGAPRLHR